MSVTILIFLILCLQGCVPAGVAQGILKPRYSMPVSLGTWMGLTAVVALIRLFGYDSTLIHILNIVLCLGGWLVIILLMYGDDMPRKLLLWLVLLMILFCGELLAEGLLNVFHPEYLPYVNAMTYERVWGMLIALLLSLLIAGLFAVHWKRFIDPEPYIRGSMSVLLLPAGQILLMIFTDIGETRDFGPFTVPYLVTQLALLLVDIGWMYWLSDRNRREAEREELAELKHTMELEHRHYRDIENRRQETAKMRHDINNQLQAVSRLIRTGEGQRAEDMLREMKDHLNAAAEYPYCAVPIVNAVLNEKAEVCRERGIEFEVNVGEMTGGDMAGGLSSDMSGSSGGDRSGSTGLTDVMLCSLFSNLLDNAIRAAGDYEEGRRWIRIGAKQAGGMLVICCRNCSDAPGPVRPGHGTGTKILKDIAERRGGEYRTEFRDGVFTATVSMNVRVYAAKHGKGDI